MTDEAEEMFRDPVCADICCTIYLGLPLKVILRIHEQVN